jgi:hypothetical protein
LAALALAGCAAAVPLPPPGPPVTRISVVQRDWHTDICIHSADADAHVASLAAALPGAQALCFGFGDREYMALHRHDLLTTLGSLLPSEAVLLVSPLRTTLDAGFGGQNTVSLGISRAGVAGLNAFLWRSVALDAAGAPRTLGPGRYPGDVFYAATDSYDGFNTCNTWTGSGLRAAGLPVDASVLLASEVMRQVRRLAAAQAGGAS